MVEADAITEKLAECFVVVFPILRPEEVRRATSHSVAEWDSVATVTLMSLLEEEFGIEIAVDDFADMLSFELIEHFLDRKSTRLNSSHLGISYAVFCLKK